MTLEEQAAVGIALLDAALADAILKIINLPVIYGPPDEDTGCMDGSPVAQAAEEITRARSWRWHNADRCS